MPPPTVTTRMVITPELLFEWHGFRAEEEALRQAGYARQEGDERDARRWRMIASACRDKFGASPLADRRHIRWWVGL